MSLIAALAATMALSVAPADDLSDLRAEDKADLQCMAVSVVALGLVQDEAMKPALATASTFFYGRLQGRTPGTDWLQRFAAYIRGEPGEDLEAQQARCLQEIQTTLQAFGTVGAMMAEGS